VLTESASFSISSFLYHLRYEGTWVLVWFFPWLTSTRKELEKCTKDVQKAKKKEKNLKALTIERNEKEKLELNCRLSLDLSY
jgi:hypothetical protein